MAVPDDDSFRAGLFDCSAVLKTTPLRFSASLSMAQRRLSHPASHLSSPNSRYDGLGRCKTQLLFIVSAQSRRNRLRWPRCRFDGFRRLVRSIDRCREFFLHKNGCLMTQDESTRSLKSIAIHFLQFSRLVLLFLWFGILLNVLHSPCPKILTNTFCENTRYSTNSEKAYVH